MKTDNLETLRAKILERQANISRLKKTPLNIEGALGQLDAWVTSQQGKFKAEAAVLPFLREGGKTNFGGLYAQGGKVDVSPLLVFLLGDTLRKRMADALSDLDTGEGISPEQREKDLKKAIKELADLERKEEFLICLRETEGLPVTRRLDCDPAVFLEFTA